MEIITDWMGPAGAGQMLSRWVHLLAGVAWIGLLYYFNFVQAPAFSELSGRTRNEVFLHISARAAQWVRWSALATAITGVLILYFQRNLGSGFTDYFASTRGTAVAFGGVLGLLMFANVWLVGYPAQRQLVQAASEMEPGSGPVPDVDAAAHRLARIQRCNALLSIPMLWFMAVGPHFADRAFRFVTYPGRDYIGSSWVVFLVIVGVVELSALGYIGGLDSPANKAMFDDWRLTIVWGFVVWAILWIGAFEAVIGGV